ncbi:MAG: FAD-dependent oxidoreductase [Gemmatimonadota bacterium]|nr:FAD-dependent oxidoreductase [Gemmatimonadota bacterium]
MTRDARVIVIGGGFAGVAAAAMLRDRGWAVTILDANRTLGGRARSDSLDDMVIDTGAQLVTSSFTRTIALLGKQSLRRATGRDAIVRDGARTPIQFGSMTSLLGFGGLSAKEKVLLGAHLLPLLALHRHDLDAGTERMPATLDRQSARGFVEAKVGARAADLMVENALNAFYAARGDEASLAFYLALARYGSDSELLTPAHGWSAALEQALRGARHEPGVRVTKLSVTEGVASTALEDGREWTADGVVIATGPRTARALLTASLAGDAPLLQWLESIPMRPAWTMALAIRGPLDRSAFGLFADGDRPRTLSACAVHGAKLGTDAPADRDALLVWASPGEAARLDGAAADAIVSAMMPDVERMVPEIVGRVARARVYRFEEGTPLPSPGFAKDRARSRSLAAAIAIPIALAGDYLTMPTIEGAVASGETAARQLLAKLDAR